MSPVAALSPLNRPLSQLAGRQTVETATPNLVFPDQAAFGLQAALMRALDLVARQQQQITLLEAEAQTDSLTGVLNHRGFHKALTREVERARRSGMASAVLVLFDLDGLKRINDTRGHAAGDAYIRALADGLRAVRATDYIGRLGGDEFALLLTDADPASALCRAERLVESLNASIVMYEGQSFPLAVSHGTAIVTADVTTAQLIAKADTALYIDKAARKAN